MKRLKYLGFSMLLILAGISFSGCSGDIYQIGPSTFTTTTNTRDYAYFNANNHCRENGLSTKIISERNANREFILDFKCLQRSSQEYNQNSKYEVGADISIKVDKKVEYE